MSDCNQRDDPCSWRLKLGDCATIGVPRLPCPFDPATEPSLATCSLAVRAGCGPRSQCRLGIQRTQLQHCLTFSLSCRGCGGGLWQLNVSTDSNDSIERAQDHALEQNFPRLQWCEKCLCHRGASSCGPSVPVLGWLPPSANEDSRILRPTGAD